MPHEMNAKACTTPGCFNTAYGGDYCSACLEGKTPGKRGPVTWREAMYARILGGEDEKITRQRLARHDQPTEILERRALPDSIYSEAEHQVKKKLGTTARTVAPQKIFLSYAKEDAARVETVYSELAARGHHPWMDVRNLLPGERWELSIAKAVQRSDYFVVFLSKKTVTKRGYVQKEIRLGLEQLAQVPEDRIYFIPVRLEACELPESMKLLHVLDMNSTDALEKLTYAIEKGAE
jgi:hypothetical protein